MLKPLVIIVGPTAVGKTALGIELAKLWSGEIISGDSMQVYKEMDIGTAKPSFQERQGIPHHMIDILQPDEEFSVAIFQRMVEDMIAELYSKHKLPIIVGGTGLYIRSIIDHFDFTEFAVDWEYRNHLEAEAKSFGNEFIRQKLAQIDPKTAERLHPNDLRRIIRALEVYKHTGKSISEYQYADEVLPPKYNLLMVGLNMDRQLLYQRINLRIDKMIEEGLIEEVKDLIEKGYNKDLISMQAIGYKEIIRYLEGEVSFEEAVYILKRDTRHFAKRQLTWFRRDQRIQWYDVEKYENLTELANEIIQQKEGLLNLM